MLLWFAEHPLVLFAPVFGAVFASFLTVVAERVPRGLSINGRSSCGCGRTLKAFHRGRPENVPVLGWLAVGGRTRCCGRRIPTVYLVAEVALAAVWTVPPVLGWPLVAVVAAWVVSAAVMTAVVARLLAD